MTEAPKEQEVPKERIIDRLMDRDRPIIDRLFGQKLTPDNIPDERKLVTKSFCEGMAQSLGVPVENINEEIIMNWILNFNRLFIKPEHVDQTIAPAPRQARIFGQQLGLVIRESIEKLDVKKAETTEQLVKQPVKTAVETAQKRVEKFRNNISLDT